MKQSILSRRQFIFGSGAAVFIGAMDAFCVEPKWLRVTNHDVPVANLPKMLDGYRIAQISDAHLRRVGGVEEKIVREIENQNVALVLLTGDIIDDPLRLNVLEEFCHNLHGARRPVLATLGNWEHWCRIPIRTLQEKYRSHRIRLLINESELIDSAIRVAATDDAISGRFLLDKTMRGYTGAAVNLFLTHSPGILDHLPATLGHFDLALAGHTHGGQGRIGPFAPLRPPGSGRFISGWYKVRVGRTYVSCGTGMSMIPARFACRPELPIFSLRQG
jgi:predicted MPP superfamily phosphohydrolase